MRRLGLIFCIYFSIISGICTGFEINHYRGFVFILALAFFFYWSVISSDFFYNHKLLRWIQYVQYFILAGYILLDARRLLSGGIALGNRLFDVLNTTFHREFSYFRGVNEITAQADILIFVSILLLLYSGILLLSRRHIWLLLFESMPVMVLLMIFSPQAIHGNFFLYFGGILGFYYLEHHKEKVAFAGFFAMIFGALLFLFYPSTELFGQEMTSIRRGSLVFAEYVSHVLNGEESVFTLNFGDIKSEAVKKHETNVKFTVKAKYSENALYFRSYVGSRYQNGKWSPGKGETVEAPLLDDIEEIASMRLDEIPNFRPAIHKLVLSYTDEKMKNIYPYYMIDFDEETGEMEYVSVGDYYQFLEYTDEITKQRQTDTSKRDTTLHASKEYLKVPAYIAKKCKRLSVQFQKGSNSETEVIGQIRKYLADEFTITANAGTSSVEDPIETFLFQTKRGNISEYASACVMLLRSCNIPARYVEGYFLNEDDFHNAPMTEGQIMLTVNDEDSYAWVEIYREGIGWIPVNPVSGDALIAASDAREIELPSLPKLTMTPGELLQAVAKMILFALLLCILRVCLMHHMVSEKKKRMTRAERILWYSRIWDRYKYEHFDFYIQNIIEKAQYSDHVITEEEEKAVYEAAYLVRADYRGNLPFYMNVYDIFLACRDIL